MRIRLTLLALVAAVVFSIPAHAQFYKSGIQMGTNFCSDLILDCGRIGMMRSEIVDAANKCIKDSVQIDEPIMKDFSTSGEFENCVLPSTTTKTADGFTTWAICCIQKIPNHESCGLSCTRYITPKK